MSTSDPGSKPMGYLPNLPPGRQPLTHPPPGRTANFEHSESNSIRGNVCAAVCMPVIVILATIRIYNKAYVKPGRTLDDYTFMLATVGALIYISLVIALLSKGFFGTHIWDLTVGDLRNSPFQLVLIIEVMWGPFVWLIKLSLFLMYLRLFEVLKWFKRLVWAGILCTGLFYISTSVAKIVLCAPRGGETYVIAFSKAQCGSTKQIGVVAGVFNIISDLYLLLIPMPAVWNLNTSKRNRLGILACFLTGIAALNASILGLFYRVRVNNGVDNTWNVVPLYLAIIVEMTCGFPVLCMPSIQSITKHHCKGLVGYFKRINSNEGIRGKCIRLKNLSADPAAQSKHRHGHTASSDSDAKLRATTTDSAHHDEITSSPKI